MNTQGEVPTTAMQSERRGQLLEELRKKLEGPEITAVPATLQLEGLLRQIGETGDADALLERASQRYPQNIAIIERAAERAKAQGDGAKRVALFEHALERTTDRQKRRYLLEQLRNDALEAKDVPDALRYQERLEREMPASPGLQEAWARRLLAHRHLLPALTVITTQSELKSVPGVTKAALWRDLARTELLLGLAVQAELHLEQAQRFAVGNRDLMTELDSLRVEAGRITGNLAPVISHLESRASKHPQSLRLLATLYTETGRTDQAIELLRRGLRQANNDPEYWLQLCQTLELSGQVDKAERCLEDQLRRAPERVELTLLLVEKLTRRGEHAKASLLLNRAEGYLRRNQTAIVSLADAWEHLGEHARAVAVLKRVIPATVQPGRSTPNLGYDPTGGDPDPSLSFLSRAEQDVENGSVDQAISLIEQGLPRVPRLPKLLARTAKVYERAVVNGKEHEPSVYEKAESLWREIIESPKASELQLTTAIEHVVRIWALRGVLANRTAELARRFSRDVPPLPQALWLAEAEFRLGQLERATAVLLTVRSVTPESWLLLRKLEQLAVAQGNFDAALGFAERRLAAPDAADRVSYATLVDYAAKTRNPSNALLYAKRWTGAEPAQPAAWASLARRERQALRLKESRDTLGIAYDLDRTHHEYLLELAEWHKADNDAPTAVALALRLLRTDPDESRLLRAYDLAVSLATSHRQLISVEQALRAALAQANQSLRLRDALLSLYDQLLTGQPAQHDQTLEADVSARATLILSESLSDPRDSVKETAIRLLERTVPQQTAVALIRFAKRQEPTELGRRALVLLGKMRDPDVLPELVEWLSTSDLRYQESKFSLAALFCLAQYQDRSALKLLRKLLVDGSPAFISMSALALAARRDLSVTHHLLSLVNDPSSASLVRAAAGLALHQLAPSSLGRQLLTEHRGSRLERLVQVALLADSPFADRFTTLAELLCGDTFDEPAFADAAAFLSGGQHPDWRVVWRNPKAATDPESLIIALTQSDVSAASRLFAFKLIASPLSQACLHRIVLDPEQARHLGRVLMGDGTALHWGPLVPDPGSLSNEDRALRQDLLGHWFNVVKDGFERYRAHPDPELRENALGLLALGRGDESAILSGLTDRLPAIREKAVDWSRNHYSEPILSALSTRLLLDPKAPIRALAAARLGELPPGSLPKTSLLALTQAARKDAFASVRMAALRSLTHDNPLAAKGELRYAESSDEEAEARQLARKLLESQP